MITICPTGFLLSWQVEVKGEESRHVSGNEVMQAVQDPSLIVKMIEKKI